MLSTQEGEEEADEENDPDYDPKVSFGASGEEREREKREKLSSILAQKRFFLLPPSHSFRVPRVAEVSNGLRLQPLMKSRPEI